jgi:hypothetical protein
LFVSCLLAVAGCHSSHSTGGGGDPRDRDGDGYDTEADCNDGDPSINPGAWDPGTSPPIYYPDCGGYPPPEPTEGNGVDDDCDGRIDEHTSISTCNPFPDAAYPDEDGDGYNLASDCNDADATVHPGADEGCCDRVDRNCDGVIGDPDPGVSCNCFYDDDGDGYGSGFGPGPDCDDANASIYPGAPETCGDGVDQDCDGADSGGYEICDGVDNDCDGLADEPEPDGTDPCLIMNGMADAPDDDTEMV